MPIRAISAIFKKSIIKTLTHEFKNTLTDRLYPYRRPIGSGATIENSGA
jgi:hypothetical protein